MVPRWSRRGLPYSLSMTLLMQQDARLNAQAGSQMPDSSVVKLTLRHGTFRVQRFATFPSGPAGNIAVDASGVIADRDTFYLQPAGITTAGNTLASVTATRVRSLYSRPKLQTARALLLSCFTALPRIRTRSARMASSARRRLWEHPIALMTFDWAALLEPYSQRAPAGISRFEPAIG